MTEEAPAPEEIVLWSSAGVKEPMLTLTIDATAGNQA